MSSKTGEPGSGDAPAKRKFRVTSIRVGEAEVWSEDSPPATPEETSERVSDALSKVPTPERPRRTDREG